jgi:CubicO group peptidase (beta-lactamase class C family)
MQREQEGSRRAEKKLEVRDTGIGGIPERLQGIDDFVEEGLRALGTPGISLSVVKDGKVVLMRGYGRRRIGQRDTVSPRTLFQIASCTKAFTATALGMLVEEGKLGWDDPVVNHFGAFQLSDPYVTREATIRDLLCHRSGLVRGDALWYSSAYGRREMLRRLRYLPQRWGFRSRFTYNNLLYVVAGEVLEAVTGKSWDSFIEERILRPLDMDGTLTNTSDLASRDDVASPHEEVGGDLMEVERFEDPVGSADGSMVSSASDMAHWLEFNIAGGVHGRRRLMKGETLEALQEPCIFTPRDDPWRELISTLHLGSNFNAYGLGWSLQDYRGLKAVWHTGGIDGMSSIVGMLPAEGLGMTALSNRGDSWLPKALMLEVFDLYIGDKGRDWIADFASVARLKELRMREALEKQRRERRRGTEPSHPLKAYTGAYDDPYYGRAEVSLHRNGLKFRYGRRYSARLQHWHYDTFQAIWENSVQSPALVTFQVGASGSVVGIAVAFTDSDEPLAFQRIPGEEAVRR